MKTRIKTLAFLAGVAALTLTANAQRQEQGRKNRTDRKRAEFKCPTCGSPCVSKTTVVQQLRQRQINAGRQDGRNRQISGRQRADRRPQPQAPAQIQRQRQQQQAPAQFQRQRQQQQANAQSRRGRQQQQPPAQLQRQRQQKQSPTGAQNGRKQKALKFDIDGDGQLSPAERAALKAYRSELKQQGNEGPARRPGRKPPVEE